MRLKSLSNRACDRLIPFAVAVLLTFSPVLLQAQPANNEFPSAQLITGSSGSVTGMTVGATREMGEPNHGGDPGGASVWYSWDAPASGAAEVDLHASDFDTTMGVYTGVSVSNLTAVAQNDDEFDYFPLASKWLVPGTQSRIRFPAQVGTRYHIGVDGGSGLSGNIRLGWKLKPRPTNDSFAEAQIITGLNGFISTHNVGATKETGEPNHATNAGAASIWFRWTAPVSGATRFHTLNSLTASSTPLDTLLAIYTGSSLGALTQIAANDNNGSSLRSLVQFTATAGTTYRIAVDTKAASTNHGHVLLTWINGTPANNNFASAQVLTGACGLVQGHNTSATKETGEPAITGNAGGASIWYSWIAPDDGPAVFTTQGSPFLDTMLAVYTGVAVNALTLVEESDDVTGGFLDGLSYSRVEFLATAGTTYRITIDGYRASTTAATGVSFLQWAFESATNDAFVSAQPLTGSNGMVTGCNFFSGREAGEPIHGTNDGGRSVWYRWQAPATGLATVDLAGSLFDTLLAVYRADGLPAVDQLTLVAQNDDPSDSFDIALHSRVAFGTTAGVTYYIAVDGASDEDGYMSDGWLVMKHQLSLAPVLQFTRSGQNIVISWNGPYTLESTTALNHPGPANWTPVPGSSPVTLPVRSTGHQFFRAVFR